MSTSHAPQPSSTTPLTAAQRRANLLKAIGPGILVACAAVGGSHLLWSTRAGATYGWSLVGLILLANLFKFPFFLYGQRYTAATGESLLAGYHRHGTFYVYTFLVINILTGVINIAGVAMLSGALLDGYGIGDFTVKQWTIASIAVCGAMVLFGHYKLLDMMSKVVIIVLTFSTLAAVFLAWGQAPDVPADFVSPSPYTWVSFAFLVSLLGWMPAPIDLSAWSSLWMFSREKQTGHFATVKESAFDFYLGYFMAVLLAVVFVALGKFVMYGSGETFSESGIGFSNQLVNLYAATIGDWSRPLILTAAFITMFSTTMTCVDGYPRSLSACCTLLWKLSPQRFLKLHQLWVVVSVILSIVVVIFFVKNLIQLLAFAAAISFVTSPILAYINLKVMTGDNVPESYKPGMFLKVISWLGLAFFVLMTVGYIYVMFK